MLRVSSVERGVQNVSRYYGPHYQFARIQVNDLHANMDVNHVMHKKAGTYARWILSCDSRSVGDVLNFSLPFFSDRLSSHRLTAYRNERQGRSQYSYMQQIKGSR